MNHIELFAGCGGLSLGLETAGFELLFANELSPMASETFAFNHLNIDLSKIETTDKVLWVSSQFPKDNIKVRLRENPNNATGLGENHFSDIAEKTLSNKQLNRSLLVGSIIDINKILESGKSTILKQFKSGLGYGSVDLVSGGPPCQSFSLAGLRDHTHHRNQLPWEFAKFIEKVKPKLALLENVSGILRPFKIDGKEYYAWYEVAKSFAKVGYVPLCLHINAKYVGTAQNRPRFIMIGFRNDVFDSLLRNSKNTNLMSFLKPSHEFYEKLAKGIDPIYGALPYYDIEKDKYLFSEPIFSPLFAQNENLVSVKDAIDDLRSANLKQSEYVDKLNSLLVNRFNLEVNKKENHDLRRNNEKVRARFRLYQVLNKLPKIQAKSVLTHLQTGGQTTIDEIVIDKLKKYWLLDITCTKKVLSSEKDMLELLSQLYTKKQTQRALKANEPAPAALSIPDDACHYHESLTMLRTLTVREMARIQSFPDWYQIKSKVTTGGQMRKFEVPQYTQIGNAVPPLLGLALGKVCKSLIELAEK